MTWLLFALWLSVQPLPASWHGDVLVVSVPGPGCLVAEPGDTGTEQCDFSGNPWEARIGRFGDQNVAASVSGRFYVWEQGGQIVGRVTVPPYATLYFPLFTALPVPN